MHSKENFEKTIAGGRKNFNKITYKCKEYIYVLAAKYPLLSAINGLIWQINATGEKEKQQIHFWTARAFALLKALV